MWSLVTLKQNAVSQRKAALAFKNHALASQPTKALLDEMNTHQTGLMTTQAAVTALCCQHSPIAMGLQEDLKIYLRKCIEDIDNLKHTLTNATAIGTTVIRAQRPGEDCSDERIAHIDVDDRQRLHLLFEGMQLVFTAKLVSSTCPGQPRPLNTKEEQLQPPVTEGRLQEDDRRQLVAYR